MTKNMQPSPEGLRLMTDIASDVDLIIENNKQVHEAWTKIAVMLRAGDYIGAMGIVRGTHDLAAEAQSIAHIASAKFQHMKHTDPTLYSAAVGIAKRAFIENEVAEWSAEDLRAEIAKHGGECDDPTCPALDVMNETLAKLEAH